MEPIPETDAALVELERYGDTDLRTDLEHLTASAEEQAPGLVGVSLALLTEGLVLTYVASDRRTAALDAVQYVDGGPCVDAVELDRTFRMDVEAVLDEARWQLFAQASAAAGIRSTLSIPIRHDGVVTGSVNLYGAGTDTFGGRAEELARLFGAWAPGAVANADLSFASRLEAVKGPERLRDQACVDQAVGLLVSARGLDLQAAEDRLREAAARAGVALPVVARALLAAFTGEH